MFKLTIKKQDGSTRWVEHFNDEASANAWLKEEKTRPYWEETFTHELEDQRPKPPTADEIEARRLKEAQRANKLASRQAKVSAARPLIGKTLNATEMRTLVELMAEVLFDEDIGLGADLIRLTTQSK